MMNASKPISESVLLRILTRKSVLWFGKHNGLKIQQMIDLHLGAYLRWIYYNFTGVTFTTDILEELTITENRRISKPGIAPEKHFKIMEENIDSMHLHTKSHMDKVIKIRSKCKLIKTYRSVNFKKSQLQAINLNRY
jgi:hypothetical protein